MAVLSQVVPPCASLDVLPVFRSVCHTKEETADLPAGRTWNGCLANVPSMNCGSTRYSRTRAHTEQMDERTWISAEPESPLDMREIEMSLKAIGEQPGGGLLIAQGKGPRTPTPSEVNGRSGRHRRIRTSVLETAANRWTS